MDDLEPRLTACFAAVLPELNPAQIAGATAASVPNWDSVATVTLLAVIEEEFGVSLAEENPACFESYASILACLKGAAG
ncbi:MAG TPA: acyl carrier protein [Terriglobales bacterium]|nr:acyl carrier protein [Terriglobales bacterium]